MATTAWPDAEIEIRPAICMRHPTGNQEMFFCFDCNRAFCTYCQLADDSRANHKTHRTIKLKELLRQRKERIAQIRSQLKQYVIKHDTTVNEANKRVDEKNRQLQLINDVIDQFAQKLHQKVEDIKTIAKQSIQNTACQMWEKSPATALQKAADETLANIREVRASLEYEIRRAELDELAMAERSKDIDALGDQLAAFLQLQLQLPDLYAFDLTALRSQLQASIAQLENEVVRSKETFLSSLKCCATLTNWGTVRLVEQQTINAQSLVLPFDTSKTPYVLLVRFRKEIMTSSILRMTIILQRSSHWIWRHDKLQRCTTNVC